MTAELNIQEFSFEILLLSPHIGWHLYRLAKDYFYEAIERNKEVDCKIIDILHHPACICPKRVIKKC
jgi:hypothetical protein